MRAIRIIFVCVLVVAVFSAVALAQEEVPGVTEDTILIGTTGPQTGPANAWGAVQRAMWTYFQALNEAGGINGRKLELIILDDGYYPPNALANVKRLVEEEEVFAIVGVLGAANAEAVKEYLDESDVPWMGIIAGHRGISEPPIDNAYVGYPQYYLGSQALTYYAVEELGIEKIGVFYQNDEFGGDGKAGAEKALEDLGLEVVEAVPYEVSDTDFSNHALTMMESGAEAVVLYGTAKHCALFVGSCAALGYLPQWLGTSAISDPVMISLLGEAWDGAIVANFAPNPQDDSEASVWYREQLEKYAEGEADTAPGTFTVAGFYFAEYLVEALKRAEEPLTRESLIDALDSFENVTGMFIHDVTYTDEDHRGQVTFYLMQADAEAGELVKITDWIYPRE